MKPIFSTIILVAALLAVNTYSSTAQTPEQLYQKGLGKEEGEGALQDAINLYNKVADNSNASISVRAKALLHIGMCFEKLGTKEAVKAYQRIVADFPTQKNEVAYARERLNKLVQMMAIDQKVPLAPKFTKIKMPTKLPNDVKLSPDGKDLAMVYDYKLWVMPLKGNLGPGIPGKPVQLDIGEIKAEDSGLSWSYDGKWIAFNDLISAGTSEKSNQSIFVVPSGGGNPKKVTTNFRDQRIVNYRISISPDGKNLAFSSVENVQQHIVTAQVDGGSPKQLADMQAREPVYSPDGRMIAFVEDKDLGRGEGGLGLWVIPTQGGIPHLLANAGKASSPVWSPDGSMIAYLDYVKQKQINFVKVTKTREAAEKVTSIDAPGGTEAVTLLAGWTPDNKIGLLSSSRKELSLYTLPATGGQATMVLNDRYASQPRWSRDGKQILYVTFPDEQGEARFYKGYLASVPANGGTGSPLPNDYESKEGKKIRQFPLQSGNRISPDGKMIITAAYTPADSAGVSSWPNSNIWKIALDGTEAKQVTKKQGPFADISPCWSPDGKKVAFYRVKLIEGDQDPFGDADIFIIDSSGGEPEILASVPGKWIHSLVWSPDGKMIAYLSQAKEAPNAKTLNVIDVKSGESRVAGEVPTAVMSTEMAWSPDSRKIAFNDANGKVIKIMNIEDGTIRDIKTNLADDIYIYQLDWSPDGKQFVFCGLKSSGTEFWFLEDFLPLEKLAQKNEKENLKESKGIKIRQVWTGPGVDNSGKVSTDGKYLSFTNWETGNLMIRNLKTGENRQLTNEATWNEPQQYAELSTISPDGKQVAYLWYNNRGDKGYYELRLIQVGSQSPDILYSLNKNEYMFPELWSSDNKKIIVQNYIGNTIWQLSSIDISTRKVQVLKEKTVPLWIPNLSLSPDDKYLAFDFPNPSDKGNYDIYLMSIDSKNELPIVEHSANDRLIGWLPGRNKLLFVSDRSGTRDLWAITVIDGKPSGPEMRIYSDIGEAEPMGLTHTGDCFLGFSNRNYSTYIVPFNVETGVVKEESGKSLAGSNTWVKWSPNGQYLTYTRENIKTNDPWQLTILDLKTGEERKVVNNLLTARSLCWSPEGNSILAVGYDKNKYITKGYKGGIYKTDVSTGQTTEILSISDYKYSASEDEAYPLSDVEWSSDGRSIFYLFFTDRLVKHNLGTGEEITLCNHSRFVRGVLNRSPDGKNLLFGVFSPEEKKSRLFTIPVEGGEEKELCTSQEANSFNAATWSPDGKYIYFLDSDGNNLWRVSAEGGMTQKVWYSKNKIRDFGIHPDGTKIMLVKPENITEIRVIENLVQELEKLENLKK